MGMRRAATVTATVPITTSAMTASTMRSLGNVRLRARKASMVSNVSGQIRSTMEKKMSRLAPLPIPRSVICSPSHITNTPPVVSVNTVVIRKKNPGLALTPGGVFVMWLGEQITERGIGNGASLLIFFSIVERIWPETLLTIEALRARSLTFPKLLIVLAVMALVVMGTVAVTVAARRIPIQIPRQVMGRGRIREGQKTFIPLRLNTANVMPIIFAQSLIIVPGTIAAFSGNATLKHLAEYFTVTSPVYLITSALLIIFFAYFYTSIIFNPVDLAENLKKQGGFIPGVKPGAATADYIDDVLSRITFPGAIFLTIVAMLPIVVSNTFNMPFGFGGTALLIVVGVALDTVTQVQQHLLLRHYDGFMKEGRVKFRGRQRYM